MRRPQGAAGWAGAPPHSTPARARPPRARSHTRRHLAFFNSAQLDAYLRKLLASPLTGKHGRVLDFLGAEKHGVRYGVRRYEYDSAQSEGNKYIRDDQL